MNISKFTRLKLLCGLNMTIGLLLCFLLCGAARAAQDVDASERVNNLIAEYKTSSLEQKERLIETIVLSEIGLNRGPAIAQLIEQCREELPVSTWTRALLQFAKRGGDVHSIQGGMLLALERADLEARCDIIETLRYSSDLDEYWGKQLTQIAVASNEPDSTFAIVTLLSIKPDHEVANQRIIAQLRCDDERIAVRAAILCGVSSIQNEEIYRELTKLMNLKAFPIRFAAAYAIAMSDHGSDEAIEVLKESLAREHCFIALRLQYPSNPGVSHKFFAIRALRKLQGRALDTTNELVGLVKLATKEDDYNSLTSQVGIFALEAIPDIAGQNRVLATQVEESTKDSALIRGYSTRVKSALQRLK